jgi:hypothetical protein
MTDVATGRAVADLDRRSRTRPGSPWPGLDTRRRLQLILAALWLWDGALQFQSFMFTPAFARQMLGPTAQGNPSVIADPITWAAGIVEHHPVSTDASFATIQLLLGLGIAWRPTVKPALGASIAWAGAVWWFGEGLGGVLTGSANPLSGAPGAVLLYALLAFLLWPTHAHETHTRPEIHTRSSSLEFVAAAPLGAVGARMLWLLLWASLAFFAAQPANRAPDAVHDLITQIAVGQPGWLASIDNVTARLVDGHGDPVSIAVAVVLGAIALGVFLPRRGVRAMLIAAVAVAAVIWVIGEALGAPFSGQATDPNSGPLLALLAAAYWPIQPHRPTADTTSAPDSRAAPRARS